MLRQHSSQATHDAHFETGITSWIPQDTSQLLSKQDLSGLSSNPSSCRLKIIPIIDPDTGTQVIIPSLKNNSPSVGQHEIQNLPIQTTNKLNLETPGINGIVKVRSKHFYKNNNTMDEACFQRSDPLSNGDSSSIPKAFKCSTPAANATDASDPVSGMSQVFHILGNPRGRLGSATSALNRNARRTGTRAKEEEILLQRINARLVGLEEDGAGVIQGLGNIKIGVEESLEEARRAVEELESMGDKISGYSDVSQKLMNIEDEMTLLSATLSQWLDADSIHTQDSVFSPDNKVQDGVQHAEAQILVGDLDNDVNVKRHEEKLDSQIVANSGDFIPILNMSNETGIEKSNINDIERNIKKSFIAGNKTSNKEHEIFNSNGCTEELNRKISIPQMEEPKFENDETKSFYYSPLQIKKLQNIDFPIPGELKLKLKSHKIYRGNNKEERGLLSLDSYIHLSKSLCSTDFMNLNENVNENIEKKSIEQEDIIENIFESPLLSPKEILNETPTKNEYFANKEFKLIEKDEITPEIRCIKTAELMVASPERKLNSPLGGFENCETLWSPRFATKQKNAKDTKKVTIENIAKGFQKLDTGFKGNCTFTEGCPSLFWIHLDTQSLADLQIHLDAPYKRSEGDGGEPGLGVGSAVLAKFGTDGKFYRARVEEVIVEEEDAKDCMYCVRYSDYGHSDIVTGKEIHSLDHELRFVPDQAVSCCFADAPTHWKQTTWTADQLDIFHKIVDQSSGQLTVELGTKLREAKSRNFSEPMFEASLCHGGASVVETLREHRSFASHFRLHLNTNAIENANSLDTTIQIEPANPISHQQPGSPDPYSFMEKGKSKVRDWLAFQYQDQEADTTLLSQVSEVESFRATLLPNKSFQSGVPAVEVANFSPSEEEDLEIPLHNVGSLKMLMDESCSFVFTLSGLQDPGKFYIHPVQEELDSLNKIHQELQSHSLKTPKERLVVPGSVWCLFYQVEQKWCRVRVESSSSTCVSVRLIDDGTIQHGVGFGSLRVLPNSWVSQLPALAVLCHLVGCSPAGKVWDAKSTDKLEKILGYKKQHIAIAVAEENSSLGLILLAEGKVVNQQMVEWGFAVSEFMEMFGQFKEATTTIGIMPKIED